MFHFLNAGLFIYLLPILIFILLVSAAHYDLRKLHLYWRDHSRALKSELKILAQFLKQIILGDLASTVFKMHFSFAVNRLELQLLNSQTLLEPEGVVEGDGLSQIVFCEAGVHDVNIFQIHRFLELQRQIVLLVHLVSSSLVRLIWLAKREQLESRILLHQIFNLAWQKQQLELGFLLGLEVEVVHSLVHG